MNDPILGAVIGGLLLLVGTAMIVGAARHKSLPGKPRIIAMALGLTGFVIGLFSNLGATHTESNGGAWLPATVLVPVILGVAIGWWTGHTSRRPVS